MCEDDAFGANQWELFAKRREIEVEGNRTFERVRLGDEQVRGARSIEEFVGPFRVAGVGDDATIALDPQREGRRAAGMAYWEARHEGIDPWPPKWSP